jgi:hypothetical protein
MKYEDVLKIFRWLMNSFFIGFGVYCGYIILEAIFNRFESLENIFIRLLFFVVIGGIVMSVFNSIKK